MEELFKKQKLHLIKIARIVSFPFFGCCNRFHRRRLQGKVNVPRHEDAWAVSGFIGVIAQFWQQTVR
jgi:hypothetical protein